ncbi:MAG: nucleotidyltransferase domain-containing protein [Candidatus Bathyarchaeia archaeon]|nr:nucleotidyltransferase domain-containing protein [Candidatus Bathyarchaeota archaeon]
MSRVTLVDIEIEHARVRKSYLENITEYLRKIKDVCRAFDPKCRLIVFGSYVRGDMKPDSDIDVLLITDQAPDAPYRGRLRAAIARNIGLVTPFEIHIVSSEEYERWYRKFIDAQQEI